MTTTNNPALSYRRDWRTALRALRGLLADGNDTPQVFRIMRALNAKSSRTNYLRLLETAQGGRLAYERTELETRLMDRDYIAGFADGTVGAAYRAFIDRTGYSAAGLAGISRTDGLAADVEHPFAWFGRRARDSHDLWHILTGYQADEQMGEACLVAFSYAQTRGTGWGVIALGAVLKSLRVPHGRAFRRAVIEGYRHGRSAAWLHGEDYEALLAEPLGNARRRLRIEEPTLYHRAQAELAGGSAGAARPA